MSLLLFDGFEIAPNLRNGILGSAAAGAGRTGGKGLVGTASGTSFTVPLPSTAVATIIFGFAWKTPLAAFGSTAAAHNINLLGDAGGTNHNTIRVAADGKIQALRGGAILATSTLAITDSIWHYFEIKATLSDAAGVIVVKVDGAEFINITGQDTKNAGTLAGYSSILLPGSSSGGNMLDDLYVLDNAGAAPYNDFLGDRVVRAGRPDGAGATTGLTPSAGSNYQCVDEDPWTTADYVSAGAVATDTYTVSDVSGFASVDAVQVVTYALKTDAGARALRTIMRSNLGTSAESADLPLTTTVATVQGPIRQTDPDAAPLTQTLVNTAQYGVKVV